MKFSILKYLIQATRKSKSFGGVIYWTLCFLLLTFLMQHYDMIALDYQTGVLVFDMDLHNILRMFGGIAGFYLVSRLLYAGIQYLMPEKSKPLPVIETEPEESEELEESEQPALPVRRRKSPVLSDSLEYAQMTEVQQGYSSHEVLTEPYFRLNRFERPATGVQDFMNSCYNNTFRITLPELLHDVPIPEEFRSFYLHFEFLNGKELEKDVIRCEDMHWFVDEEQKGTEEMDFFVQVFYNCRPGTSAQEQELRELSVKIRFQMKKQQIYAVCVDVPEQNTLLGNLRELFRPKRNRISNSFATVQEFKRTTRLAPLFSEGSAPITFYDKKKSRDYRLKVSCYCNFSTLCCPICGNPIHDLGIPGIVLYKTPDREVTATSDAILNCLRRMEVKRPNADLLQMVRHVAQRSQQSTQGAAMLPDFAPLEELKSFIRIPLASFEEGKVIPFTYRDFKKEKKFLYHLNSYLCPKLKDSDFPGKNNKLYLLKPSATPIPRDNYQNFYIHNSMIAQLCDQCWNPLPEGFYNFDEVITIYFFGSSNAGKTVLLCSEYNMLEKRNKANDVRDTNTFNAIYFNTDDKEPYQKKARKLRRGLFPIGTDKQDVIPGKLSELTVDEDMHRRFLFNFFDMPGSESNNNWNSFRNFSYVHSLLSDPLLISADSFYQTLMELLPISDNPDARTYNIQMYLTKIDEFPDFLHQRIRTLNEDWTTWKEQAAYLSPEDLLKNAMLYTASLLDILEQELEQSFLERPAEEVIPERIRGYLQQLHPEFQNLSFSMPYRELHQIIVQELISRDQNKLARSVLNYLHGLDVIRDNYYKFRTLILTLLQGMQSNAVNNPYGNYCLCIYAVSATGFSAIESAAVERTRKSGSNQDYENYAPEFLLEAHDMMQTATYGFEMDLPQEDRLLQSETMYNTNCKQYLFQDLAITENDFYPEQFAETTSLYAFLGEVLGRPFQPGDLYAEDYPTLLLNLAESEQPESVKTLYRWYAETILGLHPAVSAEPEMPVYTETVQPEYTQQVPEEAEEPFPAPETEPVEAGDTDIDSLFTPNF